MARALLFPALMTMTSSSLGFSGITYSSPSPAMVWYIGPGTISFLSERYLSFSDSRNNFHPRQMRKYMPHSSSQDLGWIPTNCFLPIALPQDPHLLILSNGICVIKSSVLHRLPIFLPCRLLWPLLTSHGSLLLLDLFFSSLARETSPVKDIFFPSYVCLIYFGCSG